MTRRRDDIVIRPFRPDEAPVLARLFHETVHAVAARDYTAAELLAWSPAPPDAAAWARRMAAHVTLVAERIGAIAGFAELEPPGHLDLLYVHKDHQGRGVASALLAAIEDRARSLGAARILTEASLTALPFFAACGFDVVEAQTVMRDGVALRRFAMEKALA